MKNFIQKKSDQPEISFHYYDKEKPKLLEISYEDGNVNVLISLNKKKQQILFELLDNILNRK